MTDKQNKLCENIFRCGAMCHWSISPLPGGNDGRTSCAKTYLGTGEIFYSCSLISCVKTYLGMREIFYSRSLILFGYGDWSDSNFLSNTALSQKLP